MSKAGERREKVLAAVKAGAETEHAIRRVTGQHGANLALALQQLLVAGTVVPRREIRFGRPCLRWSATESATREMA